MILFSTGKHRCTGWTVISCLLRQIVRLPNSHDAPGLWLDLGGRFYGPGCLTRRLPTASCVERYRLPGESFVFSPELLWVLQGLPVRWSCSSSDSLDCLRTAGRAVMGADSQHRLTPWEPSAGQRPEPARCQALGPWPASATARKASFFSRSQGLLPSLRGLDQGAGP